MVVIEIPSNPNCDAVELRVFHDVEPPREIRQVRMGRDGKDSHWCDVTGWTLEGRVAPARAQKVDDSGDGVAYLVYGGDAGLRLRPNGSKGTWQLPHPQQWGMSFLLIADAADLAYVDTRQTT